MSDRSGRKARIAWSAGAGVLTLLLIGPLAIFGYRQARQSAQAETWSAANERIEDALIYRASGAISAPDNTWYVNPVDGYFEALGDTWTEPPLQNMADGALGTDFPVTRDYEFDTSWLAYSQWIGGNDVLVTVVERDNEVASVAAAFWRWLAIALGLSAAGGLAAYGALGRMQAPVHRAHAVNRDFIADAAHELRTPLSIIQASAGFALARERPADDYRESLSEILDASERAGTSVGELLEFARLEAGQASLRMAPLRLDLLVEEVAASVRVDGVTIDAMPGEAVVVEADYNLLRQVVDNVTRNAAARADKVTLGTKLDTRQAVVHIADDGPGFDPGIIDHVFERFRRGDRSGSVGLGMAIAKTIVELHGGQCAATNRPAEDGGGALVELRLPYKKAN